MFDQFPKYFLNFLKCIFCAKLGRDRSEHSDYCVISLINLEVIFGLHELYKNVPPHVNFIIENICSSSLFGCQSVKISSTPAVQIGHLLQQQGTKSPSGVQFLYMDTYSYCKYMYDNMKKVTVPEVIEWGRVSVL